MVSSFLEDRYSLTMNMRREYRQKLRVAATLAKEMGMIEEDTICQLMNLFVNLGFEYIKSGAIKALDTRRPTA